MTDPPPARRTLNHLSFRFLSKLCRIRYLYVRVALVRVSSCPSVEVLWCVAPMEDSHGDPSQEDCIDSNPLLTGSTQATTRLSTGLGNSSQFTTQGAPHGAQDQRPAVSVSDLALDPRLMLPANTPLLSRTEPISTNGRRGVNTDGGLLSDPAAALDRNPRSQLSAVSTNRSSSSSAASFAAAQAYAVGGPRYVEDRLKSIARSLQAHPRGREPSEQDVHLIALLLEQMSHGDPAFDNQHILDVILPLDEHQVTSIVEAVQRGEPLPSGIVEALNAKSYSPFHASRASPSLETWKGPTTPAPGSTEPRSVSLFTPLSNSAEAAAAEAATAEAAARQRRIQQQARDSIDASRLRDSIDGLRRQHATTCRSSLVPQCSRPSPSLRKARRTRRR